jgi:hypothetical protein
MQNCGKNDSSQRQGFVSLQQKVVKLTQRGTNIKYFIFNHRQRIKWHKIASSFYAMFLQNVLEISSDFVILFCIKAGMIFGSGSAICKLVHKESYLSSLTLMLLIKNLTTMRNKPASDWRGRKLN